MVSNVCIGGVSEDFLLLKSHHSRHHTEKYRSKAQRKQGGDCWGFHVSLYDIVIAELKLYF